MSKLMKRSLALLLVLISFVSFLPQIGLKVSAAEVSYVYDGKYIYNWGTRGEEATFLSPNAVAFYKDNNTSYGILSSYSGGTGVSNAPTSDLYKALQKLMKDNHSYITSYNATKDLYQYTDCQGSGGKISSFYSGTPIGPAWGQGSWNREHTWPNSKGLGGSDENDIMMLRPTSTSENSSRGNTAYGKSSGYYNPNSESNGKYDLRGDVARIFLYVYVRWGNVNGNGEYTTWGTRGVMESVDVLLEWMEADPVDTWELGRNDSVESITGTRNVFVDYPELAFLLFGEEVPKDMSTPSMNGSTGGSGQKCEHNSFSTVVVAATCAEQGYTIYTCTTAGCGKSYKDNYVSAKGHSYTSVVTAPTCTKEGFTTYTCSACTHSYTGNQVAKSAHNYVNDLCTVCGSVKSNETKVTLSFATTASRTELSSSKQVWKQGSLTVTNNKAGASSSVVDNSNPARFYAGSEVIIFFPGMIKIEIDCKGLSSYTSPWLSVPAGATATNSGGIITIVFASAVDSLTYSSLSKQARANSITVYAEEMTQEPCQHTNTTVEGAIAPTCTTNGHTGKTRCLGCGEITNEGQAISATNHSFGEWKQTVAPGSETKGEERRDCLKCDYYQTKDIEAIGYLQAFLDAVAGLSNNKSAETTYNELYSALQLYSKLTNEEKEEVSEEFLVLQAAIEAYNAKATIANDEVANATEIAFLPITASFGFLAALWFLLKKKFWIK